jgi:hypothetical protein
VPILLVPIPKSHIQGKAQKLVKGPHERKRNQRLPKTMARPTKYSQAIADNICTKIATSHKSLRRICNEENVSVQTVLNWLNDERHSEFLAQYTRAREAQADYLADKMLEVAFKREGDDQAFVGINRIQRDRLIVDTMKFIASKLKPKKYGDKLDVEQTVRVEQPFFPEKK